MAESVFRTLVAWQRAMDLVAAIYRATATLPKHEWFGLGSQLRRAAVSVPSNIAEGRGRGTDREYRHFLLTARASLYEIETQVVIAERLNYFDSDTAAQLARGVTNVMRPLSGLLRSVDSTEPAPRKQRTRSTS